MKKAILHEFFVMEIQDLYDAENQLLDALPKMVEAATNDELRSSFEEHLVQTQEHVTRLEKIGELLDFELNGETCEGMEGLIAEGEESMELELPSPVRDLAIIGAAEKVEHYELCGYEMAEQLAKAMGHDEAAELLKETKDEEKKTADILKKAGEKCMNDIED